MAGRSGRPAAERPIRYTAAANDEADPKFDPSGPTWSLAYDGWVQHAGWAGGPDLDAVALPEPDQLLLLPPGLAVLGLLQRWRERERSRA